MVSDAPSVHAVWLLLCERTWLLPRIDLHQLRRYCDPHRSALYGESALAACLTVTSVFPIFFFRYARSFLLAFDSCVNWHQSQASQPSDASELDGGGLSAKHLAGLKKDDASAAYAMGMGLTLIILFGLLMAVATIYFVGTISFEPDPLSESI